MPCTLKQPTVLAHGHLPDDIEKLIGFILHGVAHMLDDGHQVPMTYFALPKKRDDVIIIDTRQLAPDLDAIEEAVMEVVEEHKPGVLACLSEAWKLPDDKKADYLNGITPYKTIDQHPDKYDVLLITVETTDGVWMMDCQIGIEGDKRVLPDTITFDKVPDDKEPHPGFLRALVQGVPDGVMVH